MWDQPELFGKRAEPFTVSEITSRIRGLLESEPTFRDLWIVGEVSDFSRASSGHIYLTLKDSGAQIGGVIWRGRAAFLTYVPATGDQIQAHGYVGVYEQGGRYQFYIDQVRPAGRGSLFQEFERLRAQLQAEGLFDEARKRPLPPFPQTIGVATSPTSAALRDVLKVLRRRYPLARVLLAPTLVQGASAPAEIVRAIKRLNQRSDVDVILLVRGGGSLEDLWAFNDEAVARSVATSRVPLVSGVGHETDFSLADFAADCRAPTPSAAAEVATPEVGELQSSVAQLEQRARRVVATLMARGQERLATSVRALRLLSPSARIAGGRQRVDDLVRRMEAATEHRVEVAHQRASALASRLASLNPDAVLARGYAIVRDRVSDRILTSVRQAAAGQALELQFADGRAAARVEDQGRVDSSS